MHRIHSENLSVEEKRSLWSAVITEYEQLDINQRQFCLEREIKPDLFSYYYRQHKKKIAQSHPTPIQFIPLNRSNEKASTVFRLVYLGFELEVPVVFEEAHLLRILKVLRQISSC